MSVEPIDPRPPIDAGKESRLAEGLPIVPALDGFRAAAIFAIVFLHLIPTPEGSLGRILTLGPLPNAIDVLFIISGFVVFLPTVARGGEFGPLIPYAIRRGARLLPAYWLAIGLVILMLAAWPSSPQPALPGLSDIGAHIIGLHVPIHFFDSDFLLGFGIDGPLWTLSLELTFYLLLPFVAGAFFRHPFAGLVIAIAITVGWKLGAQNIGEVSRLLGLAPAPERLVYTQNAAYGQFPAFTAQFAMGMMAAWLLVRLPQRFEPALLARRAVWVQAGSALALIGLCYMFGRFGLDGNPLASTQARKDILLTLALPAAIAAFMLATAFAPPRLQRPFSLPLARSLGDISYGVYLIHLPLFLFYAAAVNNLPASLNEIVTSFWVYAPLIIAVSIGYGYASARFLEQPIRRWAHRYGHRGAASRRAIDAATPLADPEQPR